MLIGSTKLQPSNLNLSILVSKQPTSSHISLWCCSVVHINMYYNYNVFLNHYSTEFCQFSFATQIITCYSDKKAGGLNKVCPFFTYKYLHLNENQKQQSGVLTHKDLSPKAICHHFGTDTLSMFWGTLILTLALLMCWETFSKFRFSSASLGSTSSRHDTPRPFIKMIAWSRTLSTRRLTSSNSDVKR